MRFLVRVCAALAGGAVLMAMPAAAATYLFSGHAAPVNSGAGNILNYIGRNSPMTFDLTTTNPLAANLAFASRIPIANFWEASGGSAGSTIDSQDTGARITTLQFSTDSLGNISKYNIAVQATNTELPGKLWLYAFSNFDAGNVFERAELDTLHFNGVIHYTTEDSALICTNACGNRSPLGSFSIVQETTSGVPEPMAWAMIILGFGLAGTRIRGQRRLAA